MHDICISFFLRKRISFNSKYADKKAPNIYMEEVNPVFQMLPPFLQKKKKSTVCID